MLSWPSGARGPGMPYLGLHSGVAMTIEALVSGGFHLIGCPGQSLYSALGGWAASNALQCTSLALEGSVMGVFTPY